jgi:hypothetical protein
MGLPWRHLLDRIKRSRLFLALNARWTGRHPLLGPEGLVSAGDMARAANEGHEALSLYGRAIDGYLAADLTHEAESVCRRIIEMEPYVIRTRYTLAAIAVARQSVTEARDRISDYMAAVARANAEEQAVRALLELASATAHPAIRHAIADALRAAGRPDYGEGVERGTAAAAVSPTWDRAIRAALTRPGDVDLAALT